MKNFYSLSFLELVKLLKKNKIGEEVAKNIFKKYYGNQKIELGKKTKEFLKQYSFNLPTIIKEYKDKYDETIKYLIKLEDGNTIETVLMNFNHGKAVCISSQVGCNMGCKFCASGQLKKIRDLKVEELVGQVLLIKQKVENITIMGIGEPLDNIENVNNFIDIISSPFGLGISLNHITISTCALVNKFNKLKGINLAISLHASNDKTRSSIMPVNKSFGIDKILKAARNYYKKYKKTVIIEYILIGEVNDSLNDALKLCEILKGMKVKVNLIELNKIKNTKFVNSKNLNSFAKTLIDNGLVVTTRLKRGKNINAACGQLRANQ